MYKCPFPECDHIASHMILNSHAKTHGFETVTEMSRVHGPIPKMKVDPVKLRNALKDHVPIYDSSFSGADSAISRLKKADRSELSSR